MAISKSSSKKLRDLYVGELVTLYLKDINIVTTDDDGNSMKIAAMLDGEIFDIDENYIYIGTMMGITKSVSHDSVAVIEITGLGGELLDNDMAVSPEEIN